MTANENGELYRAAVGDKKAHYYVPLFLRFDGGDGRASWNWPAFFVTFFWLLYRRMYGIAALYFLAFPLALVFVAIVVGAVLGEAAGGFVYLAAAIAVPWIVMPMFANAMYHAHTRKVIARQRATAPSEEALVQRLIGRSSGSVAGVVIAAFLLIPVTGILAAIAIPAYQDYTIRSQIVEGLNLASSVKAAVAESYGVQGRWPADLQDAGYDGADLSGRYVESIEVSDGTVLIQYGREANRLIAGHALSLHPASAADGDVVWSCGYAADVMGDMPAGTDVPEKYLPRTCRTAGP